MDHGDGSGVLLAVDHRLGMIIYGSYLPKNEDVVHSSCMTAVLDTCAAMLAGFAILPSVFAFGLDPASGPQAAVHHPAACIPADAVRPSVRVLLLYFRAVRGHYLAGEYAGSSLRSRADSPQAEPKGRCPAGVRRRIGGWPVYRARYAHGYVDGRDYHLHCADRLQSSVRLWRTGCSASTRWSRS